MNHCCSTPPNVSPNKHRCPANGLEYVHVTVQTILHHLHQPWHWQPTATHYYFCDAPDCDVVYFGDDNSVILKSQLRTAVKTHDKQALLCHCFGIRHTDFEHDSSTKQYVIAQTKQGNCACVTRNPSGRCCLKDFPR